MNKKGFTLIELLGVIILLVVIGLIIIPVVRNIIVNNRENAYNEQINRIVEASKKWGLENTDELSEDETYYLTLDELVNTGHLKTNDLKDPRDESTITGCVVIAYLEQYNQYSYTYSNVCS